MSFKIEVISKDTGECVAHAFRFPTRKEAETYADMFGSWQRCEIRITASDDPINYPPPEDDEDYD